MVKRSRDAIAFWSAAALVVVVSIAAYEHLLPDWIAPGNTDKALHFALGGVLAFFLDRVLGGRPAWRGPLAPPLASLLVLVPLGIDEYCQRFSATRSSDVGDFAADVAGVVTALVLRRVIAGWGSVSAASRS